MSRFDAISLSVSTKDDSLDIKAESPPEDKPFRRWMSTLRRKKHKDPCTTTPRQVRWTLDDFETRAPSPLKPRPVRHQKSSSWGSSIGFVTAVKSATATLASTSMATLSRHGSAWRRRQQPNSMLSSSERRPSIDAQISAMDEPANMRSRKRREKLDELIRTEESYVADLKALFNAYFTLLGHQTTNTTFARSTAQKTIGEILSLHDTLLRQIQQVVPFAEHDQNATKPSQISPIRRHTRWRSASAVPTMNTVGVTRLSSIRQGRRSLNINRSSDEENSPLRCSPQIISAVAQVFGDLMPRFSVYERFGANFDMIQRDVDEAQRSIATWPDFDRAIETISSTINPMKTREANKRKAMTMKDLLIKPIQRLPRYELLFNDICKFTPVCDGPDSHAAIEELLTRLHHACECMNLAKDSPERARNLETTWRVGDRLTFSSQVPRSVYLQLLGQVILCGCLHVAYRTRDRITGSYAICVLFESTLLLASEDEYQPRYKIMAGIALARATIVETDNAKGLQFHTAPHSWKIVFEHSARMYEIIFSACSATEALAWRTYIAERIELQTQAVADGDANVFELQSPLTKEMRSVGKAFGKPGSFVRRMSIQRCSTVAAMTDLSQVIIRGTQSTKDGSDNTSHSSLQIPRSQSVFTPSHVQTLAPRRADRARLEGLLADVWTKDVLPYPGMIARRSRPLKASANHVIRKFSMASITSNFSSAKRSGSYTSIYNSRKEDMPPPPLPTGSERESRTNSRPPVVDFHSAPEAFLPADFELRDPITKRKKSAFRTFTMNMERPFSPLLGTDHKSSRVRRTQSVHNVHEGTPRRPTPSNEATLPIPPPVYSVVQERPKTPASMSYSQTSATTGDAVPARESTRSKGKNKLMRLFA
ncbi:Hypothetical protein R9X50_00772600 [Acrodontium crateriforme]|uniref:DH domain-containing protein n=1 Tax=Acrodontium crateriforme TaxID=150365 RepID=A0AAQ3RAZ1_9PEZI|nr:Hypothetical protein R9X50_00772600 [Acrodontium crateriforme]